jgi:dephospho-CoA kinase
MKILILGHKEHGKSTVAEFINKNFGLKYKDSSMEAAKIFIFDVLKDKYNYKSFEECYTDRRNKRKEWYDLITEYNSENKTRLAESILSYNDMYVGMREHTEISESRRKNLFNIIIGVYNPDMPLEGSDSFNIDLFKECDFIIYNNSTLLSLENKIIRIFNNIKIKLTLRNKIKKIFNIFNI